MKISFSRIARRLYSSSETTKKWYKIENGYNTGIKIYNCIARKNIPLIIKNKNYASWYQCGPTVYDSTHIGHASCYVKLDIIQRILRDYFNINLITAMNITDIDDKIINKSNEIGNTENSWQKISKKYEKEFWNDLKLLGVKDPNIKMRVTENIPEIIEFIQKLIDQNEAYIAADNSVYFNVRKFANYGKLQKLNNDDTNETNCQNDFALWKAQKTLNEPSWPAPWGNGRPGWHIECSTMASKIFGNTIDFHAGGLDLKFPHHENEEAQCCSYHKIHQWVNYWLHTGHLKLAGNDTKMSKSLKNTISVENLLANYTKDEFRMACSLSNYRNSMEFSDEMMSTASNTLNRFKAFQYDCEAYLNGKISVKSIQVDEILIKLQEIQSSVDDAIKDDFNTAKCIRSLIDLANNVSRIITSPTSIDNNIVHTDFSNPTLYAIAAASNFINHILSTFGFEGGQFEITRTTNIDDLNSNIFIDEILNIRNNLRVLAISSKNKDLFKICDDIRNDLKIKSIDINDYNKGSSWRFMKKE